MARQNFGITINLGDPGADNRQVYAFKAPTDDHGGGVRLLEASAVSTTTLALSQGVGGTTFTLGLRKYSSAGTPVVNGTVSTNTVGGTAVGWTAGVPQTFTLDDDYTFLDAGEWLVVQYNEVNSGNPVAVQVDLILANGK